MDKNWRLMHHLNDKKIVEVRSLVKKTGSGLLELGSEDLASSFDEDLLNDDLKEDEEDDEEEEEEESLKSPFASPFEDLTLPLAFDVPDGVEPSSLSTEV
ncbi:hypothetical protein HAX54_021522 [Datura stramonium]|uniref:Uncharacterized protein n=1 Tax=Datura stramonium TaxID=4076 RepID=A0ABS8USX0_DATST|nr:hypothetical protein [Datura stramonium]